MNRLYRTFQVDEVNGDFSTPVFAIDVDANKQSVSPDLETDTEYKWRCRDVMDDGSETRWSDAQYFKTINVIPLYDWPNLDTFSSTYTTRHTVSDIATSGFAFSADGYHLVVSDGDTDLITSYTLSEAWNIATKAFVSEINLILNPLNMAFNPDGSKLYVILDGATDSIEEFTLLTPFDAATGSTSYSLTAASGPGGLTISWDGKHLLTGGSTAEYYYLSTPWDLSTAGYVSQFTLPSGSEGGYAWNHDGTKFSVGNHNQDLKQFLLSEAWDITSAIEDTAHNLTGLWDDYQQGHCFSADGTRLFWIGPSMGSYIYEHILT